MNLIPYTGKPLPTITAEGTRHTIQIPDGLFGELVAGYVYADDIEDVVKFAKDNVPEWYSVSNKVQIVYARDRR